MEEYDACDLGIGATATGFSPKIPGATKPTRSGHTGAKGAAGRADAPAGGWEVEAGAYRPRWKKSYDDPAF
jgi:hypothetical protein